MTQKTLEKIPREVLLHIEILKKDYKDQRLDRNICRSSCREYVRGLRDGGLITERERQQLFAYMTI